MSQFALFCLGKETRDACKDDLERFGKGIRKGRGRLIKCLRA